MKEALHRNEITDEVEPNGYVEEFLDGKTADFQIQRHLADKYESFVSFQRLSD